MNKRKILANINKIANDLDNNLFHKEADQLTKIMLKIASDFSNDDFEELMNQFQLKVTYYQKGEEPKVEEISTNRNNTKEIRELIFEFISRKYNLRNVENIEVHYEISARSPKLNDIIWEVGFDITKKLGSLDIKKDETFDDADYDEFSLKDREKMLMIYSSVIKSSKGMPRMPIEEPIKPSYSSDPRENAFNHALEELKNSIDIYNDNPLETTSEETLIQQANEIADEYMKIPNRTDADLEELILEKIYG